MGLRSAFKTDSASETDGVWVAVGENDSGEVIEFKIARADGDANTSYRKSVEKSFKPYQHLVNSNTLPSGKAAEILRKVFVESVLKDWRGVTKADLTGKESDKAALPFTPENAEKLFVELPDVLALLQDKAKDNRTFLEANRQAVAGNSLAT